MPFCLSDGILIVMPTVPIDCQERTILERRARADLRVYVTTVNKLEEPLTKEEFERAYDNSERARGIYGNSRDKLIAHIAEHGC